MKHHVTRNQLQPFSLLDFHCCPFHCWLIIVAIFIVGISLLNFHCQIFIVGIFIVKFSLSNFHCCHFHCWIFIVKFSLLPFSLSNFHCWIFSLLNFHCWNFFHCLIFPFKNEEQVCNPGPRIWVPKIKMYKNEVEPWLWSQDLQDPISVPKVDKSF